MKLNTLNSISALISRLVTRLVTRLVSRQKNNTVINLSLLPAILLLLPLGFVAGCSTKLVTFDAANGEPTTGIPVAKPMLVKVITTTSYKAISTAPDSAKILCSMPLITESYDNIASTDYYYINFDPSHFADGSFEISFNDKGLPSKIAVNSEASTGVDNVTGLLNTILPYYKIPKVDELAAQQNVASTDQQKKTGGADSNNVPTLVDAAKFKAAFCVEDKKSIKLETIAIAKKIPN